MCSEKNHDLLLAFLGIDKMHGQRRAVALAAALAPERRGFYEAIMRRAIAEGLWPRPPHQPKPRKQRAARPPLIANAVPAHGLFGVSADDLALVVSIVDERFEPKTVWPDRPMRKSFLKPAIIIEGNPK